MLENFDLSEILTALMGVGTAVVVLGSVISRYTKTPKDDEFFEKMKKAFFFKKIE